MAVNTRLFMGEQARKSGTNFYLWHITKAEIPSIGDKAELTESTELRYAGVNIYISLSFGHANVS